jgi:hypothetical protein
MHQPLEIAKCVSEAKLGVDGEILAGGCLLGSTPGLVSMLKALTIGTSKSDGRLESGQRLRGSKPTSATNLHPSRCGRACENFAILPLPNQSHEAKYQHP